MLKSYLWSLIVFRTHLWPLIALKPSSANINGPGCSTWAQTKTCANMEPHQKRRKTVPTDRDSEGRAGELPAVGLTLLLVKNNANITGFGFNWDHNNRVREVAGNAHTLSERCSRGVV